MDVETKVMIEELSKQQAESHQLLKKIYRVNQINLYTKFAYWIFLILLAFGSFYFIKPFVGTLLNTYTGGDGVETGVSTDLLKTLSGAKHIDEFINQTGVNGQ
ncbi:MAG: hypothetical protein ACR2IQ_00745 [Minisyncoccia bacterium]